MIPTPETQSHSIASEQAAYWRMRGLTAAEPKSPLIIAWEEYQAAVNLWHGTRDARALNRCVGPFERFARIYCPEDADGVISDFRRDIARAVAA